MNSALPSASLRQQPLFSGLLLLLFVMAFAFQGTRALWEPDEGRYTAVALQMLDSGDYLSPRLNDEQPHLTKPPLTYWMIASSIAAFGTTTWAVRLPYALCFVLTGLAIYRLARRFVPERPWLPVILWATSLLPLLAANVVSTDTPLALFETLAVCAFVSSMPGSVSRLSPAAWRVSMWAALALGFMTKGPPALLPLLPMIAWILAIDGRDGLRRLFPMAGLIAFAIIGGSWFAWLFIRQPDLVGYFFGHELVDRIFTGVHRRNPEWYGALKIYGPVLLLCVMPWVFMARRWWRALVHSFQRSTWRRRFAEDADGAFLALWLLVPLVIFIFARSRLFLYVLPLAVPIALLIGRDLSRSFGARIPDGWMRALLIWPLVALALKAMVMYLPSRKDAELEAQRLARGLNGADSIVYVGEKARYGLRFYTGLPVKQFEDLQGVGHLPERTADVICIAAAHSPDALIIGGRKQVDAIPVCDGRMLARIDTDTWRSDREVIGIAITAHFTMSQGADAWTEAPSR